MIARAFLIQSDKTNCESDTKQAPPSDLPLAGRFPSCLFRMIAKNAESNIFSLERSRSVAILASSN